MNKLSVVIITKNEEDNIQRCLDSISWADEIVVLDSGSDDRTIAICEEMGARVYKTEWLGFGRTKQKGVQLAKFNWILSLDADESVDEQLRKKIIELLNKGTDLSGFYLKRKTYYLGHEIKHSGWGHDFQLRLFNRTNGTFNDKIVHESVTVRGDTGTLDGTLWHHSIPSISLHVNKINVYTDLAAKDIVGKGKTKSPYIAFFKAIWTFVNMYLVKRGFLDRKYGFVLAVNSAYYVFLKYSKTWELWKNQKK